MKAFSTAFYLPNRAHADERGYVLARKKAQKIFKRVKWNLVSPERHAEWAVAPVKRTRK